MRGAMRLAGLVLPALLVLGTLAAAQGQRTGMWRSEWPETDFSRHSVPLTEIVSGGPPKDGIPPIDDPQFVSVAAAAQWLGAEEPVMVYAHGGVAKAYPLQILIWHEIVNDTVGGRPVAVTFCPLCNSAIVFDRRVDGRVLDFGTTGKLRMSDLVMWDRQTQSWWQQITGEAIVGELTGTQLTFLPSPTVSFRTFREAHPDGRVLSRETGHRRPYGNNPYAGYDSPHNTDPFLFQGEVDPRLTATERVVGLELGGTAKVYPYSELQAAGAVNDTVGGVAVVVLYRKGTRSVLDQRSIIESRDVGAGVAYKRRLDGRTLTLRREGDALVDAQTGSRWNLLGEATAGPLKGERLASVVHGNHFAFAWLAFRPDSEIFRAN